VEQHLENISQNQQLSTDLEMSQQHISELILEVQTCQTEMEAERIKQEMDNKDRERKLVNEVLQLKQTIEEKDKIIERLKQDSPHQINLDNNNNNLVEDILLYEWMTVAIRLDLTMHRQNIISNFDKNSFYEKLKQEKESYATWPKSISTAMLTKNGPKKSPQQQKRRKK